MRAAVPHPGPMRMLLTSGGIANEMIRDALVDLLGKPLADSRVVVVIDATLGFPGDSSTLVDHLEGLRALGWVEFDIASLFAGPASLVESRLRSTGGPQPSTISMSSPCSGSTTPLPPSPSSIGSSPGTSAPIGCPGMRKSCSRAAPRARGRRCGSSTTIRRCSSDPSAPPTVISSGHWRRYGADGALVAAR